MDRRLFLKYGTISIGALALGSSAYSNGEHLENLSEKEIKQRINQLEKEIDKDYQKANEINAIPVLSTIAGGAIVGGTTFGIISKKEHDKGTNYLLTEGNPYESPPGVAACEGLIAGAGIGLILTLPLVIYRDLKIRRDIERKTEMLEHYRNQL